MVQNSYLRVADNNTLTVIFDKLPSNKFFDAIKVRDICVIKLLNRQEKASYEPGGPDVVVRSATGLSRMITRRQLVEEFKHANGNDIVMAYLSDRRKYTVIKDCVEPYKMLKLPNNCQGIIRGKVVKPGSYIVCQADDAGNPNLNTLIAIAPNMFRKMFEIPRQNSIIRNTGKGNKILNIFKHRDKYKGLINPNSIVIDFDKSNKIAQENNQIPKKQNSQIVQLQKKPLDNTNNNKLNLGNNNNIAPINTREQDAVARRYEQRKYRFTAVARVLNSNGALLGYVIKEIKTGKTQQCPIYQVMRMAEAKQVDNIIHCKQDNGQTYLKGNGIKLESLPAVMR